MTKQDYLKRAKPTIIIMIDGQPLAGNVKAFSTGSLGYNANGKVTIPLQDGEAQKYQVSLNITAIGSKEWPENEAPKS